MIKHYYVLQNIYNGRQGIYGVTEEEFLKIEKAKYPSGLFNLEKLDFPFTLREVEYPFEGRIEGCLKFYLDASDVAEGE